MPSYDVTIRNDGSKKTIQIIQSSVYDAERQAKQNYPNCEVINVTPSSSKQIQVKKSDMENHGFFG